ncbi:MAG: LTA synthase family protein [Ruminococcaceae bacterium]|nr:LTA synthase family protein [Oscillospiraceae bacterium]
MAVYRKDDRMEIKMTPQKQTKLKRSVYLMFFPLTVFYLEMVMMFHCYDEFLGWGIFYTFIFSMVFGLGILFISSLFNRKTGHIISIILTSLVTLYMCIQAVYFTIFKNFTTISQFGRAGEVIGEFATETFNGIKNSALTLILLLIPLILLLIFGMKFRPQKHMGFVSIVLLLVFCTMLQYCGVHLACLNTTGVMSYEYVYTGPFAPTLSVPRFGMLTTLRFEIQEMIFGERTAEVEEEETPATIIPEVTEEETVEEEDVPAVIEYDDNVLEIDFDSLIASETDNDIINMHEYFRNKKPTSQNEYTGKFEGYNLIWICAEGFSRYAVSETFTPTLYKMANEGFVFENFYNPIWGVSTSDGEYTTMTGLIPKSGVWSYSRSSNNYMPYGFGNILSPLGYECRAYHNHTYTYYDRHESHPNMGYDYKGKGNGLDVKNVWPESDVEMMELTIPEYVNDERFHTYYMTVSGHLEYNFMGNTMANRHKEDVQAMLDAGYSEAASAYVACNIEFENSVAYIIEQLEAAGKLNNTLIVISGDHYPYGLTVKQMEELAGGNIEENFELYRSTLIVWSSQMTEPVHVDKYCSSLDIMPTILNLLGVDYDSRLIMGEDILSDSPGFVEFNNRSYITDCGRYNSTTDEFTLHEGCTVSADYAVEMIQKLDDEFEYSAKILENDYYAKVFDNE